MFELMLILASLGLCLFWGAWRDYANGNARDSKLMAGLGVCTVVGSAGVLFAVT